MKTIINVANRLPITIGETIQPSSGGLVGAMESLDQNFNLRWVGWAGGHIEDAARQAEVAREIEERFNYTPIFLSQDDADDYYDGFSNSSLWPLLHYMTTYSRYVPQWFRTYERVNEIFADAVIQSAGPDDLVWIHDYHLMLLPEILRRKAPHLKVGFFLHTPFPSSEVFRCHPRRGALIEGLLGADLIGFHTYGYLRHFRSTVLRVLGIESDINSIPQDGRRTALGVYPIGINSQKIQAELQSDTFREYLYEYRQAHQGKKVVLSVERLDYTKGIPTRLDAIEQFLSESELKEDIVFIFISVPSREDVEAYQRLVDEVQGRVSQINGKFSSIKNVPLHFIHQSVNFSQLCALYALADVCLVTPLIDGMNLVAKEYVACKKDFAGVLILSEFAGAAQELSNALTVNPYNADQMVERLKTAMTLSHEEKKKMMAPMLDRVMDYDATRWAKSFLNDLDTLPRVDSTLPDTQTLSPEAFEDLLQARSPALFLDYDGTLAELQNKPADAYPRDEILVLFERLQRADNLDVYIISGRKREDMDQWFSSYGFTLVAEHGYFYKPSGSRRWLMIEENADLSWMDHIEEIYHHYSGMTPGSSVEVKTASVVWHYRESDPEFGKWKAHQLVAELHELLSNLPVEIHHGKKIVEVSSILVNKGAVLEQLFNRQGYDAALCTGDDETDESMFRVVNDRIVSIKVGDGDTAARYRVAGPKALRRSLMQLLDEIDRQKGGA